MNETNQPVPPVLYKYYPPERIDVLGRSILRFSPPTLFNDAFDCVHNIPDKSRYRRLMDRVDLGILCLTEDPDNHLMWVQYAAQHKGFVVGFNTSDAFFEQQSVRPSKVDYCSAPPPLLAPDVPLLNLSLIKSDAWTYEREWRCVRSFDKESRDVCFEPSLIAEIIIGSRMEWFHISQLLQYVAGVEEEFTHTIAVSESQPDQRTWKFTHARCRKALCTKCTGDGYVVHVDQTVGQS